MEAKAIGRKLRISPLKLRKVINQIRGKNLLEAIYILKNLPNKGARLALKVLNSAIANLKYKSEEKIEDLSKFKVLKICVDQAPVMKRIMPRARGRADIIRKQSSHLLVIIGDELK
jgi:large subunit ribosomal protein L22